MSLTIYKARIVVTLKNGVLDPQGKAIEGALSSLGFDDVQQARQGKIFDMQVAASSKNDALKSLEQMADKLLANTVIEDYSVTLL